MQEKPKTNEDEEIEGLFEEYDFNKPNYIFLPKGAHVYKQRGYYLVCFSCELQHGVYIGPDKVMVGEKEGKPIIKDRKEVGLA